MKPIERTLKYVELHLVHDLQNIPEFNLPDGYHFEFFKDGDEKDWVEIEMSSGEFLCFEEGLEAFNHYYGDYYEELKQRCLFIVNSNGEKVATATAFYLDKPVEDITGNVHWVSVKEEYQGKGLSKPLIAETLKLMKKLGHSRTLIPTQTHTWLAVKVYLDMGFEPYNLDKSYLGWQIIKKLTNHPKLNNINYINDEDMYNPLYIKAYEFLKTNYEEPFTYKVWDEEKQVIGINKNGLTQYYNYKYENNKLVIL